MEIWEWKEEGAIYPYISYLHETTFLNMFEKYLEIVCNGSPMKVNISAKKDKIVIEKI